MEDNEITNGDIVKVHSLKELCVDTIARNVDALVTKCSDCAVAKWRWRFPFSLCRIPSPVADMILKKLGDLGMLNSERLALFSKDQVNLRCLILKNAPLTPSSLSIFRNFTLYNIIVQNVTGVSVEDFTCNFSESTFENLLTLTLTNMRIANTMYPVITTLGQLRNLCHLNISYTNFDNDCLYNLTRALRRLKSLDISRTRVTDITCLVNLGETLTSLIMHKLELDDRESMKATLSTILELKELRVLDVSNELQQLSHRFPAVDQLIEPGRFPYLERFDMSDNPFGLTVKDVE
nr:growth factor receptor bound protein [Hymenolepis microstoma]